MLQTVRKHFAAIVATLALSIVPALVPVAVHAAPTIGDCLSQGTGLSTAGNGQTCTADTSADQSSATKVQNIVTTVINIFSIVVGIIAVIMIVLGGFKYITSGGDSGNITSAKNTIVYAVIGLVIVALAQVVVKFVFDKVNNTGTGAPAGP